MIKLLRFSLISLAGILSILSMTGSGNILLPISFTVPLLIWLFLSPRFPFIHNILLPVYIGAVISGLIFGNSTTLQLLLLLLILTAWDIDSLYIDSKGIIRKSDEWLVIKPLLIREVLTAILVFICVGISGMIPFTLGFWPLILIVLLLIYLMRKLYKFNL